MKRSSAFAFVRARTELAAALRRERAAAGLRLPPRILRERAHAAIEAKNRAEKPGDIRPPAP
jgi:hypothetical protein